MVEGVARAQEASSRDRTQRLFARCAAGELAGHPKIQVTRHSDVRRIEPGEHAQRNQLIIRTEEPFLESHQVARPLTFPWRHLWRARGVHRANARIEERLDRRVRMRRRARIVRIVEDAGDAGVGAAQRRDEVLLERTGSGRAIEYKVCKP